MRECLIGEMVNVVTGFKLNHSYPIMGGGRTSRWKSANERHVSKFPVGIPQNCGRETLSRSNVVIIGSSLAPKRTSISPECSLTSVKAWSWPSWTHAASNLEKRGYWVYVNILTFLVWIHDSVITVRKFLDTMFHKLMKFGLKLFS